MTSIHDLPTPALVIDLDRLERNIAAMAARADQLGVRLRPHIKTHKCVEIGRMQQEAGASGITVSTLYEAEVFATAGSRDMTWAFPVVPSRLDQVARLADRVALGVVVDCREMVEPLARLGCALAVWIKVDCGYHRCGVDPEGGEALEIAGAAAAAGLPVRGLLSHSGDAYAAVGEAARAAVAEQERARIVGLAERLRAAGHEVPEVSVGSTPAMTAARDLGGVTEARPGNYVYFDRTQVALGSCTPTDCAATIVATVVSSSRDHSVIDAGALALSKDAGLSTGEDMGGILADHDRGVLREDVRLTVLSQEHGKLDARLRVGERVRILPHHSCLAAACFTHAHVARGDEVISRWRVWNGR